MINLPTVLEKKKKGGWIKKKRKTLRSLFQPVLPSGHRVAEEHKEQGFPPVPTTSERPSEEEDEEEEVKEELEGEGDEEGGRNEGGEGGGLLITAVVRIQVLIQDWRSKTFGLLEMIVF